MTSVLSSPRLRRIIVAYTVNRLGTWFGLLALVVAVFDHTHSAPAVAGLLFAGQALPAFLVPAVVARVEASRRRRELSFLYLFEALVTGLLAVLVTNFWLPAVLLLVAADGTAALAASALLRAELARAARDDLDLAADADSTTGGRAGTLQRADLDAVADGDGTTVEPLTPLSGGALGEDRRHEAERSANAALNVAFSATFVAGPVLGGGLVAATGASTALLIDVASFLACGALLLDLHPHVEEAGGDSVRARLRAAWQHINEVRLLRALLAAQALALAFTESGGPIEVTFVKGTLGGGDGGLGLVLTMWGAGSVIGSLVFARLVRRSLALLLGAGTMAIGASYLAFAAAGSIPVACAAGLLGGVGNGLQWPSLISLVQRLTPERLHGRLMGAVESLGALCLAVGLVLGGALVALSSTRIAFLIVGAGAIATTGVLLRLSGISADAPLAGPADGGQGEPGRRKPHKGALKSLKEQRRRA